MFYLMFYPDWLTARAKERAAVYGCRFSEKYNWFEFESLEDAKALLRSLENGYLKLRRDENHYAEGTLSLLYVFDGTVFKGLTAAEIFTLNEYYPT